MGGPGAGGASATVGADGRSAPTMMLVAAGAVDGRIPSRSDATSRREVSGARGLTASAIVSAIKGPDGSGRAAPLVNVLAASTGPGLSAAAIRDAAEGDETGTSWRAQS